MVPSVANGKVRFSISHDLKNAPSKDNDGTVSRTGAVCVGCGTAVDREHIKTEGRAGRMGAQLLATVGDGNRTRIYLEPTSEHEAAARVPRPTGVPDQELGYHPKDVWTPPYGLTTFADLFTARQLTALTTFSDLVSEAREHALADALTAGMPEGDRLEVGGTGAAAYADTVTTYLGLSVSKLTVFHNTGARWRSDADKTAPSFGRQAIPMVWDYAETQPFAGAGGDWLGVIDGTAKVLAGIPASPEGFATQASADSRDFGGFALSTDPPYYDCRLPRAWDRFDLILPG